ncbi:MAG: GNAT family N-acetyltransferase [Micrococcales bacterium]|nr:GNAT family N-acetyltransferase [Micrococcales bacterium]MCL2668555.1 GNAT family N-acetyltransferase [Micrococcales bacterium]
MPHRTTARAATNLDVPDLVELCLAARAEAGTGSALCTEDDGRLAEHMTTMLGLPGAFVLVAGHGDQIEGFAAGRTGGPTLFSDSVVVDLQVLYVRASARRRGVGHALLVGLVSVAEAAGAAEVVAAPLPGARGVQRFLARAGFQAVAGCRVAGVAALRRRLDQALRPVTGAIARPVTSGIARLVELRRHTLATGEMPAVDSGQDETTRQVSRTVATRLPARSATSTS